MWLLSQNSPWWSVCIYKRRGQKNKKGTKSVTSSRRDRDTEQYTKRSKTPIPKKQAMNTVKVITSQQLTDEFSRMHFDSTDTEPTQGVKTKKHIQVNTVTNLDSDPEGKTHRMTAIVVKLQPTRDTLKLKVDMGAEANILPVRIYGKMFPNHINIHNICIMQT